MTQNTSTRTLTIAQRRVMRQIDNGQTVSVGRDTDRLHPRTAQRRVLQALADGGLLEFDDRYPWIAQRPGLNAQRREAERARQEVAARARAARIAHLAQDPLALATAVTDLEIRLKTPTTVGATPRGA